MPTRKALLGLAALLVGVMGGLTYRRYRRDLQQAQERIASDARIVPTACGPIECAAIGEGIPLLVVHGAGGGFDQGLAFATDLARRGFQAIVMSRFGYLRTPLPRDASPAAQADAHACLLDALNIPRAAILGASAGAPSTMQFALRYPERCTAMILLVPLAYRPRPPGESPLSSHLIHFLLNTVLRSSFLYWQAINAARSTMIRTLLATPVSIAESAAPEERARLDEMLHLALPLSLRRRGLLNDAAIAMSLVTSLQTKRVSPHTIRHTAAVHLLRGGADINTIRAWLGHVSVDTTNIYA